MSLRHRVTLSSPASAPFATDVFDSRPHSGFAVLVAAQGSEPVPDHEELVSRMYAVREDVFVGGGLLAGDERDADDDRACAIVVAENLGDRRARICGGVRLIFRTFPRSGVPTPVPLPIESEAHFGDLFDGPLPADSIEVSRLWVLADSGGRRAHMLASLVAFTARVATVSAGGDAYAMLGDDLVRPMRRFLPLEELSGARQLEYPTPKVPVRIPRRVLARAAAPAATTVLFG
ncbi:hypothetical protein [Rathayibacter sp. Leaf296]|uniref:hypothetical protein n=1 Tax=Rathayibacter sp. Leaf296 TaxID=1736327 RepID=UPI00070273D9|nr:hypothetical protein [Rathayibacter sp. Leaf296]KQQ07288.1 hypothetical protein ASF46_16540 [Rathayibacter sp. Leaf296]